MGAITNLQVLVKDKGPFLPLLLNFLYPQFNKSIRTQQKVVLQVKSSETFGRHDPSLELRISVPKPKNIETREGSQLSIIGFVLFLMV